MEGCAVFIFWGEREGWHFCKFWLLTSDCCYWCDYCTVQNLYLGQGKEVIRRCIAGIMVRCGCRKDELVWLEYLCILDADPELVCYQVEIIMTEGADRDGWQSRLVITLHCVRNQGCDCVESVQQREHWEHQQDFCVILPGVMTHLSDVHHMIYYISFSYIHMLSVHLIYPQVQILLFNTFVSRYRWIEIYIYLYMYL